MLLVVATNEGALDHVGKAVLLLVVVGAADQVGETVEVVETVGLGV